MPEFNDPPPDRPVQPDRPAPTDRTSPPADPPAGVPAPMRRPVLLVVDGNEPLREALRLIFEFEYEVLLAESGPRALSMIQRDRIDAAIVDLRLPGMSGVEFIAQSRSMDPDIPMVVLSALGVFESAREAIRAGAFDLHPKPFDLRALRQSVQKAARRRDWQRRERAEEDIRRRAAVQAHVTSLERDLTVSLLRDVGRTLEAVCSASEALEMELGRAAATGSSPAAVWRRQLEDIVRQAASARDLAARGSARSAPGDRQSTCDAAQVLENLARMLRASPAAAGRRVVVQPLADRVLVRGRDMDLLRALANLGLNALECASAPHRVDVEGWIVNQALDDEAAPGEPLRQLWKSKSFQNTPPFFVAVVRDDGPGVHPDAWPYFCRTDALPPSAKGGSGMGWAAVREAMEGCGGAAVARTEPGRGSSFTLYVPVAPPSAGPPAS